MSLKEKLTEALNKKENDINSFVWKGKKSDKKGQSEVKMVDCTVDELKSFLRHCDSMLYNNSNDNPGRYLLLETITEQRDKCNAELFIRWMVSEKETPKYVFLTSLRECLNNNPQIDPKTTPIELIVGGCPTEYKSIPISVVIDGCMDTLGKFDKRHLTLTFILKQGVWLSSDELKKVDKTKDFDTLTYVRQVLGLIGNPLDLRISPKGLSLSQMQSMVSLRSKKYSELSILQLETLRNRVLFSLENEVRFHIKQWENRKKQIKLVLQSKGVNID